LGQVESDAARKSAGVPARQQGVSEIDPNAEFS